jgi:uncharacterized protein (DUF302 family)
MNENGLIRVASRHSVEETLRLLESALTSHGLQIFARIDHSGEAEKAGLKMPPTKLLIFGSPKGGTPLMVAAPSLAIDLPLKALISADPQGQVWVSYNDSEYLRMRHDVPQDLIGNISGAGALIKKTVE